MFKKKGAGERSKNKKTESSQWDTLAKQSKSTERKTPQELNAERQCRKIEAYFLSGEDKEFINMHDVDMLPEHENDFLQQIRNNKITRNKKERLLKSIQTPLDEKDGCERTFGRIAADPYQVNILSMITGKRISAENDFGPSDLPNILQKFETPLDFEDTEKDILEYVEKRLTKDDFEAFTNSMRNFKHNVYGKREEYYEQIKKLEKMAGVDDTKKIKNNKSTEQTEKSKRPKQSEHNRYSKQSEKNKRHQRTGEKREKLKNNYGVALISKGELTGKGEKISEDSYFIDAEKGIYAVFDGVGGSKGGSAASQCASNNLWKMCEHGKIDLAHAMQSMHHSINTLRQSDKEIGQTTATIAQIENDPNGKILNVASIGDSRMYLMRDGQIYQLTRDDNVTEEMVAHIKNPSERRQLLEHGISKCLGDNEPTSSKICSEGNCESYQLEKGDRIMLCSDGITGDTERDYMRPSEIQRILEKNPDNQNAAQVLMQSAKKIDDRTAIVITV